MSTGPPDSDRPVAARLQLWFEMFRDLALIQLALAGGIITLIGTVFVDAPRRASAFVGVIMLGVGAISSLIAQVHVVDLSDTALPPDKHLRFLRGPSLMMLGAGSAAFILFALRGLGLKS